MRQRIQGIRLRGFKLGGSGGEASERLKSLGFGDLGSRAGDGIRVWKAEGFGVHDFRTTFESVQALGFRIQGLGFRVSGGFGE